MQRLLVLAALGTVLSALTVAGGWALAGESGCEDCVPCEACGRPCHLRVSTKEVKKSCWEVECRPVCIPPVRFPWSFWSKGCDDDGCAEPGRVRMVNVLVKKSKPGCETVYEWKADCLCDECASSTPVPTSEPLPAQPATESPGTTPGTNDAPQPEAVPLPEPTGTGRRIPQPIGVDLAPFRREVGSEGAAFDFR